MTKCELVDQILKKFPNMTRKQLDEITNAFLSIIKESVANGQVVEMRGFGSFGMRRREAVNYRNPRTGELTVAKAVNVPYFKAGKEIKTKLLRGKK